MMTNEETSLCRSCKQVLPTTLFWKRKRNPSGLGTQCKPCATSKPGYKDKNKKNKKYYNPEYHQERHYQDKYGLSLDEVKAMAEKQNHRCAVCDIRAEDAPRQKLNVDHSHVTGKVRKLLCHHCNVALGHLRDDRTILARLDQYLKDHE